MNLRCFAATCRSYAETFPCGPYRFLGPRLACTDAFAAVEPMLISERSAPRAKSRKSSPASRRPANGKNNCIPSGVGHIGLVDPPILRRCGQSIISRSCALEYLFEDVPYDAARSMVLWLPTLHLSFHIDGCSFYHFLISMIQSLCFLFLSFSSFLFFQIQPSIISYYKWFRKSGRLYYIHS